MVWIIDSIKSIPTHMDYAGQARAEKLSRIIVTLFGLVTIGVFGASLAAPSWGGHHKHVVIHVPQHIHTVHHHHTEKVPYPVHHVEKVHVPVHHVEKVHVPVPYPVHHVEKVHVPVHHIEKVHVPVPVYHKEEHEEQKWWA